MQDKVCEYRPKWFLFGYILPLLQRINLLGAAFRIYEIIQIADFRFLRRNVKYWGKKAPDGLPIPPAKLRILVAGTPDISGFLNLGKVGADSICGALEKNGIKITDFHAILDFGCGCGRVMRYWKELAGINMFGTDYNSNLIDWCRENLPFAQFDINTLSPPLNYDDEKFDFIYALSVFAHLPEDLQLLWLNELSRVLKPGGYLLITTHGEHHFERLTLIEQEEFKSGQLVTRFQELAGANLCCSYHPPKYVLEKLVIGWDVIDFIPGGSKGTGFQDIFLLKPPHK